MKQLSIRLLTLLLALVMVLSMAVLVSCGDPEEEIPADDADETTDPDTEDPGEDIEEEPRLPIDYLPDTTFGGEEIHFLSWSANGQTDVGTGWIPWEEIDVDDYDGGDISTAVYDRNGFVEEKYDVVITSEYISVDQGYNTALRNNHTGGDDTYQLCTLRSYEIKTLVLEGLMSNMFEMENLHTDMPWWSQDSVRSFTLGSALFFAAPEMLLRDKGATATLYYNAKVAEDKGITGLYEMVLDGTWTFEEFISICEDVAASMDGDDIMNSAEDLWGSHNSDDAVYFLFAGAGFKFAHTDDDGYLVYDFGDDESILFMQDIFDNAIYVDHSLHGKVIKDFVEGDAPPLETDNALFRFDLVKSVNGLRDMESDFGVLPVPKMDEYQEDYHSLVWVHHDCVLGIPAVVGNVEATSVVLEHMSYLSYYDVYPVFYDTVILGKSTRDQQSKEMLELIFKTRWFDPGQIWDNGEGMSGIHGGNGYLRLAESGNNNIASVYKTFETLIAKNFEELNEAIDEWS